MYQFKQFQFDPHTETLTGPEKTQTLRPKVAQLLMLFITQPHKTITREQILQALWQQQGEFRDAALTQSIQELRKALGDNAQQPEFIRTLPQKGYLWIVDVKQRQNEAHALYKNMLWPLLLISVIGIAIWAVSIKTDDDIPPDTTLQQTTKPRLTIKKIENLTGQSQLDWWGFAIAHQLKHAASGHYVVLDEATTDTTSDVDVILSAQLTQQQQRFVLNYQIQRPDQIPSHSQLVSEDLSAPLEPLADKLISQLIGEVTPLSTEHISTNAQSRQNYFSGLRALSYSGLVEAKPFFEAALAHDPRNRAAQLELANIVWKMGRLQQAQRIFTTISIDSKPSYLSARYFLYFARFLQYMGEYQRGEKAAQQALEQAQTLSHQRLMAEAYQVQADLAWLQLDWQAHQQAMHSAKLLVGVHALNHSESQRAFYIANPPNVGVEHNNEVDLADNLITLRHANQYYQQQGQQAQLMRSYFALGQNYLAALDERNRALVTSLTMAKTQGNIWAQQQILSYLAFFHIQLHQPHQAINYLEQLKATSTLPPALETHYQFLLGMAKMDSALRAESPDQQILDSAKQIFWRLIQASGSDPVMQANARLLLGWLLIAEGEYVKATEQSELATRVFQQYQLDDSAGYGQYTQMYIQLRQQHYEDALSLLSNIQPAQKLSAIYAAYAHLKLGSIMQALSTLENAKKQFSQHWQREDETLLGQIKAALESTADINTVNMDILPLPYSVYCQSEWVLE
ncbi:winged helix-turn-helix domain-containing protein [Pseudoalteromonas sp. T1lg65]|uniref:winged helix-turn-helix domain-containing protein n=1 Tax=Pseudoalteromonas sp. T1lg65 TaxID=2077101 RepID=UPI003F7AADD7